MPLCDESITLRGSQEAAWRKLVDWQTMHEWDLFVDRVRFDGPLSLGSSGRLKMKGGPEVNLVVTSFNAPYSYTDELTLFGTTLVFHHELSETSPGLLNLRIMVEASGFLAPLLSGLMSQDLARKMPILMNNFKEQLERTQSTA